MRILAFLLLLFGISSSAMSRVYEPVASIVVTPNSEGVLLEFFYSRAVRRAQVGLFSEQYEASYSVDDKRLRVVGGVAYSHIDLKSFSVKLAPDRRERDRSYTVLFKVGTGYAIFEPALRISGFSSKITTKLPAGWISEPKDLGGGYLWFGPKTDYQLVHGARLIADASVPESLKLTVASALKSSSPFYISVFGELEKKPAIIISTANPGPFPYRGDVSGEGVIALRFMNDAWMGPNVPSELDLKAFIWHETFHLWGSPIGKSLPKGSIAQIPWFYEGAAEYATLILGVHNREVDDVEAKKMLGSRLNECSSHVDGNDFGGGESLRGRAIYDCGIFIQWCMDMQIRTMTQGRESILGAWRKIFVSRSGKKARLMPCFLPAVSADFASKLMALLAKSRQEGNNELKDFMSAFGVVLISPSEISNHRQLLVIASAPPMIPNGSF